MDIELIKSQIDKKKIPQHVAIIMDGNGRWAKKRGLPRVMGHMEGVKNVRKILKNAAKLGIKYLTVYAFSTENWKRPQMEVDALMKLFKEYLKNERKDLKESGVKLVVSGRVAGISEDLLKEIAYTENFLNEGKGILLNIAFNYGGRAEIIDAVNKIIAADIKSVDEETLRKHLYCPEIPDPDLVIRTSGEFRLSNFLTWQTAYSEIYVTEKFWPEFEEKDLIEAVLEFTKRERRFGGI